MKRNNRLVSFLGLLIFLIIASACDSGNIYPKPDKPTSSIKAVATFSFVGRDAFPMQYTIVLGTYSKASPYPLSSLKLNKPEDGKEATFNLDNVPIEAETIELTLNQRYGNKRIHTFYSYPIPGKMSMSTIVLPPAAINLASFARVSDQLFMPQCIQCHGGSEKAAANLYLTNGKSYSNLVNVDAVKSSKKRVVPKNQHGSFLLDVLTRRDAVKFTHTDLSTLGEDDVNLVREWIQNGAQE